MKSKIFFALFISFFYFPLYSFALDFAWTGKNGGGISFTASSPSSVCNQIHQSLLRPKDSPVLTFTSATQGKCSFEYWGDAAHSFVGSFVADLTRLGDSCTLPLVYNESTRSCESPPPECKVGDLFPSKGSVGPVITSDNGSKHVSSNPQTMCQNQCEYADPTARPSGCYALPGDQGYCNFIIKGTGNNCLADNYEIAVSGDRLNPPDTPNVPDSSPDPICPPGWSSSGGTCFKNPPKFCDPSTGEICAPGTTDPNKPAPDAGTGGTEGTPSEGEGGRGDSSSGADKDLQDLQDSKPDAEACKPAADGSGCSGSTVKGEQCDKVIECTGDAVQCSILRQQKKMACAYEYEEARPFIEQQIAKEPYQVKSESVSGSELFTAGLNAPRWMPQGCPVPKSISIKGVSTSLSFEPACDFARGLGPLFVALASIFFAVYVGRAFGGN